MDTVYWKTATFARIAYNSFALVKKKFAFKKINKFTLKSKKKKETCQKTTEDAGKPSSLC
jgi:hypothetical protein